jgi:uncharacterized protein (DUF1330 family)
MNRYLTLAMSMLTGAALGAAAVSGLNAQTKAPGAYAVIDISEITDADTFTKQLLPKVPPSYLVPFGGQYLARTDNITAIDGAPPRRFVIISFDSMDKAKAFNNSPIQQEVNALRLKATKSRAFLVEGFSG